MSIQIEAAPIQVQAPLKANTNITKKTIKGYGKFKSGLLIAALSALALNGIYQATKSRNSTKLVGNKYLCKQSVPEEQQGYMGQDLYDPRDPYNNTDPDSPFYQTTGMFGQNLNDPNDPFNKEDPQSPYYDPEYKNV